MHGFGVDGRMDGDSGDAQLLGGAQDPQGDFAAIGDQDFVEHRGSVFDHEQRLAIFHRLAVLDQYGGHRAGGGATMSLNVFIASISSIFWPLETCDPISTKALASGLGRR